jgi:hypothetical protein
MIRVLEKEIAEAIIADVAAWGDIPEYDKSPCSLLFIITLNTTFLIPDSENCSSSSTFQDTHGQSLQRMMSRPCC